MPDQRGGNYRGKGVGGRKGVPDSVQPEETGKNHQQREKKNHLADETEEDGGADIADGLEIGGGDDLETYHPEAEHGCRKGMAGEFDQRNVADKGAGDGFREGQSAKAAQGGDGRGGSGGEPEDADDATGKSVTVVEAGDGLHTLTDAQDDTAEHGGVGDEDAGGGDGFVAAVMLEGVVDEDIDEAGGHVDDAGSGADADDSSHQGPGYAVDATGEDDRTVAAEAEMAHYENHGDGHGDVRGDCGSFYAESEEVDEGGSQEHIQAEADEHGEHGAGGIPGSTHHVVEGEGQVGHQQPREDEHHEVAGVGDGLLVGAEPLEDGVHENREQSYVEQADCEGQRQGVAEDAPGAVEVSGPEEEAHAGGGAGADKDAKGRGDVHHREGDGQSGDGFGTYHLADDNAVDDVVELHHQHPDHGGEGVFPQKTSDGHPGEFAEFFGIFCKGMGLRHDG